MNLLSMLLSVDLAITNGKPQPLPENLKQVDLPQGQGITRNERLLRHLKLKLKESRRNVSMRIISKNE